MEEGIPILGHHTEICIDVENIEETVMFYKQLGFRVYSGGIEQGWCTLTDGIMYLGLFKDRFIQSEFGVSVLFNYRGGNNPKINAYIESLGIEFLKRNENVDGPGTGDSLIEDPNGFKIYFDTAKDEDRIE